MPVTIKCNIDLKGVASTWGIPALANAIARDNAPLVDNILQAGAIPIARTNCPDLGMRVHTDSSLHGLTRNPWNFDRTTAGSSGGEGAALASGMSPLGFGNDIGGSLRNPANACGIASIRPSAGIVPDVSQPPFSDRPVAWQLMAVHGAMARTVADVRLGLKAIAGESHRDPLSLPAMTPQVRFDHRVAVVPAPPGGACAPIISSAVRRAADALSDAGYEVVEVLPPHYEDAISLWGKLLMADYASLWQEMAPLMGESGRTFFEKLFDLIPKSETAAELSALFRSRDGIARDLSKFMNDYPLVLSPTWTQLPFVHGYDAVSEEGIAQTLEMMRPAVPANLLGLPSACVPASRDPETGLPIGVLITGRRFRDEDCLAAAEIIEQLRAVATPINPAW